MDQREQVIESIRNEKTRVLVCTDVLSRGLDLPSVDHVIQFNFATDFTSYLHRIGRTARANSPGKGKTLYIQ